MKRIFLLLLTLCLCVSVVSAETFDGCALETRRSNKSGRFIWKPLAAHFLQSVIIASRRYFPLPPTVKLYTFEGRLIETAKLKSTGLCAGYPECLFAATYLTKHEGSWYGRRYGGILVRFIPQRTSATVFCKYYQIPSPRKRYDMLG